MCCFKLLCSVSHIPNIEANVRVLMDGRQKDIIKPQPGVACSILAKDQPNFTNRYWNIQPNTNWLTCRQHRNNIPSRSARDNKLCVQDYKYKQSHLTRGESSTHEILSPASDPEEYITIILHQWYRHLPHLIITHCTVW